MATSGADFVWPGQGGLSVSPGDPLNLPVYRRPPAFQGTGKDPVWMIDGDDLGSDLAYRADPNNADHGFVEPARKMTLSEYQLALEQTQCKWRRLTTSSTRRS